MTKICMALLPRYVPSLLVRNVPFHVSLPRHLRTFRHRFCTTHTSKDAHPGLSPCAASTKKPNIIGLTRSELAQQLEQHSASTYRISQIFHWLYARGVQEFDQMTNLKKEFIKTLQDNYTLNFGTVVGDVIGKDGTRKWLVEFGSGQQVETVFIPETHRGTICLSSQIGCSMKCAFCHTGTQPLLRNLSSAEIVGQLLLAKRLLFDFPQRPLRLVTNIVFMGQGEPFYNYSQLKKAISIITDPSGLSISKRRIVVSTSGVVPNILRLGRDFPGISLAISLHAVTDELRSQLVPVNRQWPISELLNACKAYTKLSSTRRITFEYVMLKNVNDSAQEARTLSRLLKDQVALVNLIPFNPWPGTHYEPSDRAVILEFARIVQENNIPVTIRWSRGQDISAACGQLKTVSNSRTIDNTKICV
ncbi:dual-specificity RNA methyltransferase RlmN-like [Schistocerca gregaria]|uniref:dual-specificity RNA methyltransferase RlmN-like n=1 Tax=Schistocerca gregaria TaxID=7010 RepID=UPI00211DBFF7|nr:dual-specificity RNA methyltransferase RlmN-like [Schistocerca gregaria]